MKCFVSLHCDVLISNVWSASIGMFDYEIFDQHHLPSLLSMKCLNTTGPIVSSALRVLTFKVKIIDSGIDGEYDGNDDDDEDSNQVLNVSVHHGKPCALRVVTVLNESNHHHLIMIILTLHLG